MASVKASAFASSLGRYEMRGNEVLVTVGFCLPIKAGLHDGKDRMSLGAQTALLTGAARVRKKR